MPRKDLLQYRRIVGDVRVFLHSNAKRPYAEEDMDETTVMRELVESNRTDNDGTDALQIYANLVNLYYVVRSRHARVTSIPNSQSSAVSKQQRKIGSENREKRSPKLPKDGLTAQKGFHNLSVLFITLYGRGSYNYLITPNAEMRIHMRISLDEILKIQESPGGAAKAVLEAPDCWRIQEFFDFYCAAARKIGLRFDDVARQFETEFSVDPLKNRQHDGLERSAWESEIAMEYRRLKTKILKMTAALYPKLVKVDDQGEPIWDGEKHGRYAMVVTRTDQGY